jgi:quercetin dioxygenase-like cupin family protein
MNAPKVRDVCTGGLAIHLMIFEKSGDINIGHSHIYNHHSFVSRGRVLVESNGKTVEVGECELIFIPAGITHTLTALEDTTYVMCLHSVGDENLGDIIDHSVVPPGTYDV